MTSLSKRSSLLIKKWERYIRAYCRRGLSSTVEQTAKKKWVPSIGLEVHAQIATESKLFSGASTKFAAPVNSCVSLFDCAIPGTMPVLNRKCVEAGVSTALALSCKVNEVSLFERKHYFYADLPAGFQITQHKQPLAVDGEVTFHVEQPHLGNVEPYTKTSRIKQIQLEQDSGRSWNDECSRTKLIDLNRSGMPLMEIVFEPDLSDGEEAAALIKELILILETLGTCSCKIEEGALRVDANISVSRENEPLGVRTEIKNIGSVRAVAAAVAHEIKRQIFILNKGGVIVNETRSWDSYSKQSIPMREKEEKLDYRFMPETNLPPLRIHIDQKIENKSNLVDAVLLKEQLPELPEDTRCVLKNVYGLPYVMVTQFLNNRKLMNLFLKIMSDNKVRHPQRTANFITTNVVTFLKDTNLNFDICTQRFQYIREVIDLMQSNSITLRYAVKLLHELIDETGKTAVQIVEENDWFVITDPAELKTICSNVIKENPKLVRKHHKGQSKATWALAAQVINITSDRVNKYEIVDIITNLLR